MGLITDFFLATPSEVENLSSDNILTIYDKFPYVEMTRVDPGKLNWLEALLTQSDVEEIENPEPILDFEESWVFPVREVITNVLVTLNSTELAEYAAVWAKTEEWETNEDSAEVISKLLQDLSDLLKTAKEDDQLFVFVSV